MAEDEKLSLHVDTDWKKQAQEEKRRLAEQQQKAAASPPQPRPTPPGVMGAVPGVAPVAPPGSAAGAPSAAAGRTSAGAAAARGRRELPTASFATLVQSIMTQALFYLGELAPSGAEPVLNLDMAKHQIDTLGVVEEKTANNLNDDEKRLLDAALYETRTRFIQVAQQFIG
jgi:hypothetical protein